MVSETPTERAVMLGNMDLLTYAIKVGHKVLYTVEHFGKEYVWMRDPEGTLYMEKLPDAGQ